MGIFVARVSNPWSGGLPNSYEFLLEKPRSKTPVNPFFVCGKRRKLRGVFPQCEFAPGESVAPRHGLETRATKLRRFLDISCSRNGTVGKFLWGRDGQRCRRPKFQDG